MDERRKQARNKSFLQGRLYYNHRRSSVDCLVRDLSENGARLKFSSPVATPDIVELHIPARDEVLHAHIIWRLGDEVGVCFGRIEATQTDAPAAASSDLAGRVQSLETEVIALRRLLVELRSEFKRVKHAGAA